MKAKTFLIILIVAISYSLTAQNADFRNVKWGMDSLQVKKVEVAKFVQSKRNFLVYEGTLGTLDTKIIYNFSLNHKLFNATYCINSDSKNPQASVNNFLIFQGLLTQKYKTPYEIKTSTINGKVISQDEWAFNLISDNLILETSWKTMSTKITLSLYSLNDELFLEINYSSLDIHSNDGQKELITKDL